MLEISGLQCRELKRNIYEVINPYKPNDITHWLNEQSHQLALVHNDMVYAISKDITVEAVVFLEEYARDKEMHNNFYIHENSSDEEDSLTIGVFL